MVDSAELQKLFPTENIRSLAGGHMNKVFLVESDPPCVAKILAPNSREQQIHQFVAARLEETPRFIRYVATEGVGILALEYIPNCKEIRYRLQDGEQLDLHKLGSDLAVMYTHMINVDTKGGPLIRPVRRPFDLTGYNLASAEQARIESHLALSFQRKQLLVHGDFTTKNILTDGQRHVIIDWEAAHLGNIEEDLSWFLWYNEFHHQEAGRVLNSSFMNRISKEVEINAGLLYKYIFLRMFSTIDYYRAEDNATGVDNWLKRLRFTIDKVDYDQYLK